MGQPPDGDWRASYGVVRGPDDTPPASDDPVTLPVPAAGISKGWKVEFRRVDYDVDTTIRKIHDEPRLDNFLGDRLRDGR